MRGAAASFSRAKKMRAADGEFVLTPEVAILLPEGAREPAVRLARLLAAEVNRNLVTYIDQQVLGRAHPEGWGTVLSTIPTISTTLLGVLLGQLLRSERSRATQLKAMIIAGAGCLATGLALSLMVPVIMKLWTVTYGLMSAGWACLIFGLFYWVVDIRGYRRWSFPLTVIGMNALAAYLGPTLVPIEHITGIFTKPLAYSAGGFGVLIVTGAVLLVNWTVLYWMHRRRIYLRA